MNSLNLWYQNAFFYHIYPLGFCGCLTTDKENPASSNPGLKKITSWIPHLKELGINAVYLGPVFESDYHGYDTRNYFQTDSRLGSNADLKELSHDLHAAGIRLVLDGVFNHVGRGFWAFQDLLQHGTDSAYYDWFQGIHFDERSPLGDSFSYDTWQGHYELVKLNLKHPPVRQHLLEAVRYWMTEFQIDGLRLDVADCLEHDFIRELHQQTKSMRSDFWLMGEVIHGDYRTWVNPDMLDSVTNYENYKSNYSSLADKNYYEIAYSLNRQYGPEGIYRNFYLYNFVDNHDVDRVAGKLSDPAWLYPLHLLLFTQPGIPSIYYGSEWGLHGRRSGNSDTELRPCLELSMGDYSQEAKNLQQAIIQFSRLRSFHPALQNGNYTQLLVASQQFAFMRETHDESICVVLNSASSASRVKITLPKVFTHACDLLNSNTTVPLPSTTLELDIPPCWGRVLKLNG